MAANSPIALRARCGGRDTTPIEFPGPRGIPRAVPPTETSLFSLIPFLGQTSIPSGVQKLRSSEKAHLQGSEPATPMLHLNAGCTQSARTCSSPAGNQALRYRSLDPGKREGAKNPLRRGCTDHNLLGEPDNHSVGRFIGISYRNQSGFGAIVRVFHQYAGIIVSEGILHRPPCPLRHYNSQRFQVLNMLIYCGFGEA